MRRLALTIVMLGILTLPEAPSTFAASLLGDIERGMKKIERNLCSEISSPKCKTAKLKPAFKSARMARQARKAKLKDGLQVLPDAVPVNKKPAKNVPAEKTLQVKPEAPTVPDSTITIAPPMATPRYDKLKVGGSSVQPDLAKPVANPGQPPLPTAPPATAPPAPMVAAPTAPLAAASASDSSCLAALAAFGTSFAPVPQPDSSASCQVQTPVRLFSIASKVGPVKLPDQPTVNCAFALKFSTWVDQRLQGLAQREAASSIVAMGTGPGFDCRGRNGDSSSKMSEHAIGNAVDIVYIKLASKALIMVKDALNPQSPNFAFLRDMRADACVDFNTVLGPGANAAHAEHFHIDLAQRRGDYRLCE